MLFKLGENAVLPSNWGSDVAKVPNDQVEANCEDGLGLWTGTVAETCSSHGASLPSIWWPGPSVTDAEQ